VSHSSTDVGWEDADAFYDALAGALDQCAPDEVEPFLHRLVIGLSAHVRTAALLERALTEALQREGAAS
jgi:ribosomal protein S12 methylthiotransferase accessory factor YcaO